MISLILPYWQRLGVAQAALRIMAGQYPDLDLEVIVVDDGSPEPFETPAGLPWPVRVLRLPSKNVPLNPCVPFNRGAELAQGDVIALSNPETLHRRPVLPAMRAELAVCGPAGVVLAACQLEGSAVWHCHSSVAGQPVEGVPMPAGAHWHFLSMMCRPLWEAAGGFDEDYRDGAGYDDPDLVLRLDAAGARFKIRDDLVVTHVRNQARAAWSPAQFERNRRLFVAKWSARC